METFLEILREILKGIVREVSGYFFRKNVIDNKKTTHRRRERCLSLPEICRKIGRHIVFNERSCGE